jgi:hypothetical protein
VVNKEDFADRLKIVMDRLGHKSGNSFALAIKQNVSKVHKILRGENNPMVNFCEAIFSIYPEVNMDYLITGRGEPIFYDSHIRHGYGEYDRPEISHASEPALASGQAIQKNMIKIIERLNANHIIGPQEYTDMINELKISGVEN